jgi:hypothetical protein
VLVGPVIWVEFNCDPQRAGDGQLALGVCSACPPTSAAQTLESVDISDEELARIQRYRRPSGRHLALDPAARPVVAGSDRPCSLRPVTGLGPLDPWAG